VHPKCFNTLRRIKQEDGSVIEEEEQFTELVSSEYMMKQLAGLLEAGGKEKLDELPDGTHSGLARQNAKGMFFYFTANKDSVKSHFWKYYDLKTDRIIDNRYLIGNLIACSPDTPRVIGDCDAFEIQQRIIDDILRRHEQQRGLESAPKTIDPLQQTIATTLQGYLNNPNVDRKQTLEAIKYLNQPMLSVHVKELRALYNEFQKSGNFNAFIEPILDMTNKYGKQAVAPTGKRKEKELTAEDLRLVCFDYIVG
ncbi:MAG TPA: helicase, partial [bacterium]|nr:helicase [bacterium]